MASQPACAAAQIACGSETVAAAIHFLLADQQGDTPVERIHFFATGFAQTGNEFAGDDALRQFLVVNQGQWLRIIGSRRCGQRDVFQRPVQPAAECRGQFAPEQLHVVTQAQILGALVEFARIVGKLLQFFLHLRTEFIQPLAEIAFEQLATVAQQALGQGWGEFGHDGNGSLADG